MERTNAFTPEEVFRILRINQETFSKLSSETDSFLIERNDTILEWRRRNDLVQWPLLYPILNKIYNMQLSEGDWSLITLNENKKSVWEFCEFISKYATKEDNRNDKTLSKSDLEDRIFVILMRNLQRWDIDVREVNVSSKLSVLSLDDFSKLVVEVSKFGVSIADTLELKVKVNASWLEKINIFNRSRYYIETGKIKTFRDLVNRIIDNGNI